ncbi:unnamed protein product [Toxocara canis]|uniref:Uncharacterized protein n=1 Tax=Toxocara canis TaxID=6265 RepID=A0A183U3D9_TOXCA|nr:unnamed protein product [Toxocara canis]
MRFLEGLGAVMPRSFGEKGVISRCIPAYEVSFDAVENCFHMMYKLGQLEVLYVIRVFSSCDSVRGMQLLSLHDAQPTSLPSDSQVAPQPPLFPSPCLPTSSAIGRNPNVDQIQLRSCGPQTNCWPILNPDLRPPPATTTGNFLPPVGFVELLASYNTTPCEIIQQNGSGDGHQRLTSSSVTELPSELSLGYKLVVEPSEDRARPVDMDLLHSQPSRVQISVMQPQLVNYSMEQLRECSLQQSLPPAMHQPNVLLRFCKSLQADLLNNVVQERWNAATETSGCGGILGPSVVHRVPFVVQQQQSCCGLSSQNGAFSQSNVAYFPGDVPHTIPGMNQSACRQPCMSVSLSSAMQDQALHTQRQHPFIISMEQQDQAYCAARNRWPAESGLRPRVGGMSCPSATGASEIVISAYLLIFHSVIFLLSGVARA